jgi:UDP-N-acetylglucosamine 2-epimerase (non-hydrolysing)
MSGPLLFVAGARPNFMKIAPILRSLPSGDRPILVHTGQHYDFGMSGVFFEQLQLPTPDVHLQVGSGPHGAQTGAIMQSLEAYISSLPRRPRAVVVVGDVNSTMAATLVAAKLVIPVAHVEAGLRSQDRTMPEEINRVVTDALADLLLVSEPSGIENLRAEGMAQRRIVYVGNVMIDSLVDQLPHARELAISNSLGLVPNSFALVTLHRPSNVDDPQRLRDLSQFLRTLAAQMPVVFPVHPRTRAKLDQERDLGDSVRLVDPLGYREFISLLDSARVVVTDSGGLQEETSYLGIPCVTLRKNTERPITITRGTNQLVGDDLEAALAVVLSAVRRPAPNIDGWDGHASTRIVAALNERYR